MNLSAQRNQLCLVTLPAVAIIFISGWIDLTVWLYRNPIDPLNPPLFDWTEFSFWWLLHAESHLRHRPELLESVPLGLSG